MRRSARLSMLAVLVVLLIIPISCKDLFVPAEEGSPVLMDEALVPPPDEEPFVVLDSPATLSRVFPEFILFSWHSGLEADPKRVRYLLTLVINHDGDYDPTFNILVDLNQDPERYEDMWSRWYPYAPANEMGREVLIGDDEELVDHKSYIFAVQAMDRRGNVTRIFSNHFNAMRFLSQHVTGPLLLVAAPELGDNCSSVEGFEFCFSLTSLLYIHPVDLAPGVPVNISWVSNADNYGGEIAGFRYGWDIEDISDPDQWATDFSLDNISAPEVTFESGIHTFYVESLDTWGNSTPGAIEITIVP